MVVDFKERRKASFVDLEREFIPSKFVTILDGIERCPEIWNISSFSEPLIRKWVETQAPEDLADALSTVNSEVRNAMQFYKLSMEMGQVRF